MHRIFLQTHASAGALVAVSAFAYAALEWLVTLRERRRTDPAATSGLRARMRLGAATLLETSTTRTGGESSADRGTKRILMAGSSAASRSGGWRPPG